MFEKWKQKRDERKLQKYLDKKEDEATTENLPEKKIDYLILLIAGMSGAMR